MNVPIKSLRLHPDAERVPGADNGDLHALRESLRERGQIDPLDVTDDGQILDGRTRWLLLKELRHARVDVRTVTLPDADQRAYIIDRALARRHLTLQQKQALNALLRETVVGMTIDPDGSEVKIGHGQTKRAEVLGVGRDTVKRWDREDGGLNKPPSGPTHQIDSRGRVSPLAYPERESTARNDPHQRVERDKTEGPQFMAVITALESMRRTVSAEVLAASLPLRGGNTARQIDRMREAGRFIGGVALALEDATGKPS